MRVINMMMRENLFANGIRITDGVLVFDLPLYKKRKLDRLFKKYGFTYNKYTLSGIPYYALIYRKRVGLMIGTIVLITLIYVSSSFVWRVNVIGNETLDDTKITEDLQELGFGVGSYIPSVDVKLLANEFLLSHPELAWMSINIIGNCVDIRVREAIIQEEPSDNGKGLPSVLVASRDGFIERIELENGEIIKNVGQTVREGETIISGVIEMADGSFRLVRSAAKVYAKTSHTFTVEIPYTRTVKNEVALENRQYSLIFFSSLINLPIVSSKPSQKALTHESTVYLTLPGDISLPVGIMTRRYYKTVEQEIMIDRSRAEELARREISRIISTEYHDSEVIAITRAPLECEDSYKLEVTLTCIENIAYEKVITTDDYIKNNTEKKDR